MDATYGSRVLCRRTLSDSYAELVWSTNHRVISKLWTSQRKKRTTCSNSFAVRYREVNDDLDNNLPTGEGGDSSGGGEGGSGGGGRGSEEEIQLVKSKTRWRKLATRPDIVTSGYVPSHLRRDRPMRDGSRPYAVTLESDGEDDEKIKRVTVRAPPTVKRRKSLQESGSLEAFDGQGPLVRELCALS